ncbi:hypothetical protein HETIRDRAFT_324478 [Heterobasidion irregulare TC 32-1]|uniref:BTB domain-containing protein n=1 Tax=Heterobasidion irregulare (strain TC 32-1) TaxID=747525 RepID=W4JYZ0_HETIT|nr:uncharacterized protein HETIRDRAFT_324478 [Heterobasidion irregulare TC 32-1]ETW78694.1 hypothetical protein HETIRDRAFT_324478 [Heterobasidion irregulare TC 32-1]
MTSLLTPAADDSDFGPPFDDADADIILRSSDGFRFHVYKVILSKASPFFRDMFSIPQPKSDTASTATSIEQALHVIPVSEDKSTLASLLKLCYPLEEYPVFTIPEVLLLAAAAKKYDMDRAYQASSQFFARSPALAAYPATAYGIACKHHLEEEARIAALQCLNRPMSLEDLSTEMQEVDGRALYCLWQYHRKCADKASSLATEFSWIERRSDEIWNWAKANTENCRCDKKTVRVANGEDWLAREWWTSYMERAREGLTKTPASTTVTALRILYPSIEKAGPCGVCCQLAAEAMISFSNHFAKQVDLQIAQVS